MRVTRNTTVAPCDVQNLGKEKQFERAPRNSAVAAAAAAAEARAEQKAEEANPLQAPEAPLQAVHDKVEHAMVEPLLIKYRLTHLSVAVRQSLNDLVVLDENCMKTDPLSADRRRLRQEVTDAREAFCALCATEGAALHADEDGKYALFSEVRQQSEQIAARVRHVAKVQLVKEFRKDVDVDALPPVDLDEMHRVVLDEQKLMKAIQARLEELLDDARLTPETRAMFAFSVVHSGQSGDEEPFSIRAEHILGRHWVYEMCFQIGAEEDDFYGEEIKMTLKTLQDLKEYLKELESWRGDLQRIMWDLLALGTEAGEGPDEVSQFLSVGKKPVVEVVKSPIRMSERVVRQLRELPQDAVVLLGSQATINLEAHPRREAIRAQIEKVYAREGMVGSNGLPKTFMKEDPAKWCSVLNVQQIQRICPHLNRQLAFERRVKEFTEKGTLEEALRDLREVFGMQDILLTTKMAKIETLNLMTRGLFPSDSARNAFMNTVETQIMVCADIAAVEATTSALCEQLLGTRAALCFKEREPPYEPSEEEVQALYNDEVMKEYNGGQRHKNVARVFASLRHSDLFKEALEEMPDAAEAVTAWETAYKMRLNEYHFLPVRSVYYGKDQVDRAVECVESYVAQIVYCGRSRITKKSVTNSLIEMVKSAPDFTFGCGAGFVGRSYEILGALSRRQNKVDEALNEWRQQLLEAAFQRGILRDVQSSHAVVHKDQAQRFLSLGVRKPLKEHREMAPEALTLVGHVARDYHPVSVYKRVLDFFSDKIWALICEGENEAIIEVLRELGMTDSEEVLARKYAVGTGGNFDHGWQFAYLQQDLPLLVVRYLLSQDLIAAKVIGEGNHTVIQHDGGEPYLVPPLALPAAVPALEPARAAAALPAPWAAMAQAAAAPPQAAAAPPEAQAVPVVEEEKKDGRELGVKAELPKKTETTS